MLLLLLLLAPLNKSVLALAVRAATAAAWV